MLITSKVRVTLPIACINAFFGRIARTVKMYLMSCDNRIYMSLFLPIICGKFNAPIF